jgi:hypothetical protein
MMLAKIPVKIIPVYVIWFVVGVGAVLMQGTFSEYLGGHMATAMLGLVMVIAAAIAAAADACVWLVFFILWRTKKRQGVEKKVQEDTSEKL